MTTVVGGRWKLGMRRSVSEQRLRPLQACTPSSSCAIAPRAACRPGLRGGRGARGSGASLMLAPSTEESVQRLCC